jgi:pimeloyl-ACP methyl ester carboxylesterase
MSREQLNDVIRHGAVLASSTTGELLLPGELSSPLVVFVHGFTASGRYLRVPAACVQRKGYHSTCFDYNSYEGIDNAAAALAERLHHHEEQLAVYGVVFVGHSMGGLVVRCCVHSELRDLKKYVRGVGLLGTPNEGTLQGKFILARLLEWGETTTGIMPFSRLATCRAARQLTLSDKGDKRECFLTRLNEAERKASHIQTLSISGGLKYLELGNKPDAIRDIITNALIQRLLGEGGNDGLVQEKSADLGQVLGKTSNHEHKGQDGSDEGAYVEYKRTNHGALTYNQAISDMILDFLRNVAPLACITQTSGLSSGAKHA